MRKWCDIVGSLNIKLWKYRKELDPQQVTHIGPMADQWAAITGFGNGHTIDLTDALGICLRCIQELQAQVDALKAEKSK